MGRTLVRVVVRDHVSLVDPVAELAQDALDDLRHRAHEHRRRVGLGQLVSLSVEKAGAEVLGLADDRRVGHPEEDAAHLLGDRLEGPADHPHQDGRGKRRRLLVLPGRTAAVHDDVPVVVDLRRQPRRDDGSRVVLLDDRRARDRLATP